VDIATLRELVDDGQAIRDIVLDAVDWQDLDLADAVFQHCVFPNARFAATTLNGARFSHCHFRDCRFTNADLRGSHFTDCNFTERAAETTGVTFIGTDLRETSFTRVDLSMARVERCVLFSITLQSCNLLGANFDKSDFSHGYSRKQTTTRASFLSCNLGLSNLSGLRLPGVNFTGSRLREADLAAADLSGADLRDCDLYGAILDQAKLDRADLRGADITGLNLLRLASFKQMKIEAQQQHFLLLALGLDVDP